MIPYQKPKILFVCIGNACRSQMAEGFAKSMAGAKIDVFSAGSRPAGFVARQTLEVMMEIGIDVSKQTSKGLSQIPQEKYDAIITMGCGDACPHIATRKRYDWKIEDPIGRDPQTFQRIRDEIEQKVRSLVQEILPDSSLK